MLDREQVARAVHEEGQMLRADGGDLVLVDVDAAAARVHLRLDLAGVSCLDCILPPDFLRQVIDDCLRRRIPGEFELRLDDPRLGAEA
jgi:Fe-S cluster biogenesis protein NfuA